MSTKKEKLVVKGSLESLEALRRYAQDSAVAAGVDENKTYGLLLAIDEIATNIVIHGYNEHSLTGDISISAEVSGDELSVTLEDTSPEFDSRKLATPSDEALNKPLEERAAGGLGVYLALQNIDRFDYQRVNGINRNIFVVNCSNNGQTVK